MPCDKELSHILGKNSRNRDQIEEECYCSVECQRKDWDFHRFACAVVAKKSDTVKA